MKHSRLMKVLGVVLVISIFTPHTLAGYPRIKEIKYTATFSQDDLRFSKVAEYDMVSIKEGDVFSDLGKPVVPQIYINIAIPSSKIIAVEARALNSIEIPGTFYLMPGQPPMKTSESRIDLSEKPDAVVYSSSLYYPDNVAELVHQSDLAGQEIAHVIINPLQYIPKDRRLILNQSVELIIRCELDETEQGQYHKLPDRKVKRYEEMVTSMVVNPEDVVIKLAWGQPSRSLPDGDFDHVIITSSSYTSAFQPLVDWNSKRGLKDTTVTTTWIYSNYSGSSNAEKIRNFIIDASASYNWGTMYFLLGGESGTIPFVFRTYESENTPSDHYYSDYDDDWTNEVYVGRASVQSTAEVTRFINKVLKYEKDPPLTNYPLDILLIGMDADNYTDLEDMKEVVDGYIPSHFDVTKVYDSHSGNHETNVKNALNDGQNMVNHADHAYWNYLGTGDHNHWWGLNNGEIDALTNNNKMCIVVSLGCWPNAMDYSDCIAEHFVIWNDNQAGVAFTGNTRSGYYYQGQPQSLSGILDRDWWKAVFQYNQFDLGKAMVWSKHNFGHGSGVRKHCEWTFTLLGEPAMPILLNTPGDLDVTHPTMISTGSQSFTVTVEDNGSGVGDATVCLMKGNDVYEVETTNYSGDATFTINPMTSGTMYVTVTKYELDPYIPYEGTCEVSGTAPDVTVTITPDATTVPRGGTLGYTAMATNNGSSAVTLQYWTDIILWNGNPYAGNPLFGPFTFTLNPGQTVQGHVNHAVPPGAPLQTYTCYGRVGWHPDDVWDEDYFEFTIIESDLADKGYKDWQVIEMDSDF